MRAKILSLMATLLLIPSAISQIVNGGFENGIKYWSYSNDVGIIQYQRSNLLNYLNSFKDANGGNYLFVFGPPFYIEVDGVSYYYNESSIWQKVTDFPKKIYILSFDCGTKALGLNYIIVEWNGAIIYNGPAPYSASQTLSTMSFKVASTGHDTIKITSSNTSGYLTGLDNISLTMSP